MAVRRNGLNPMAYPSEFDMVVYLRTAWSTGCTFIIGLKRLASNRT
jgi:hypothetical protein